MLLYYSESHLGCKLSDALRHPVNCKMSPLMVVLHSLSVKEPECAPGVHDLGVRLKVTAQILKKRNPSVRHPVNSKLCTPGCAMPWVACQQV